MLRLRPPLLNQHCFPDIYKALPPECDGCDQRAVQRRHAWVVRC